MPLAALILGGSITRTRPYPTVEPFNLGGAVHTAVEPFDLQGPSAFSVSVEPFWMIGSAVAVSVEPFDFGSAVALVSAEPFDILDGTTPVLPVTDLGDGLPVAGTAEPVYGWWSDAADANEDLGPMETV